MDQSIQKIFYLILKTEALLTSKEGMVSRHVGNAGSDGVRTLAELALKEKALASKPPGLSLESKPWARANLI